MTLRYGIQWDRDYFLDIVLWYTCVCNSKDIGDSRNNSLVTIISSLTIYPANFYLLIVDGPSMNWEIRTAYLVNLVAHIMCDWIFTIFIRVYTLPPYGLYYCEGLFSAAGFSKQLMMGLLSWGIVSIVTTFYILMMRLHQLTVAQSTSRWKLSRVTQLIIYTSVAGICMVNMVGFIVYGADVDNYEELIKEPELAWLVKRGGTLLLYGAPGQYSQFIKEIWFILSSAILFFPFLMFFIAHALIYLHKDEKRAMSTKTQLLTQRLFETFLVQICCAIMFVIIPLGFILASSVVNFSGLLSGPVSAACRFICIMLLELNPSQFALVFILRNATHRNILTRRFWKIKWLARFRNHPKISQPTFTMELF